MAQICSPERNSQPVKGSITQPLFGALPFAFRFRPGLAAFRLAAALGCLERHALVLALWFGVFLFGRRENLHGAAGLLYRSDCGFRGPPHRKFDPGFKFAFTEELYSTFFAAHQPCFHHDCSIDGSLGVDQAGIDRSLNLAEIDFIELGRERRIAEAALWQAPMERHLAALKTLDPDACSGGLTLAAPAAGLAHSRADAAADPHALFTRTRLVRDLIEFHRTTSCFASPTTRTRC